MEEWEERLEKQSQGYFKSSHPTLFIVEIKANKGFSGQKRWRERREAHHLRGARRYHHQSRSVRRPFNLV